MRTTNAQSQLYRTGLAGTIAVLACVAIAGCPAIAPTDSGVVPEDSGTIPPADPDAVPEDSGTAPSGAALFTQITQTDPYEQWAEFPEWQRVQESGAPHRAFARVLINLQVEDALDNFTGSLPDGSIIVKENLGESTSGEADALTVMWKVAGYDPDNNDWFWASLTPAGEVNMEGKLEGCIGCHGGARDNDFIFVHPF